MSTWALYASAAAAGLAASAHCAVMCSLPQRLALRGIPIVTVRPDPPEHAPAVAMATATVAGGGVAAGSRSAAGSAVDSTIGRDWLALQAGRVAGYAVLGLVIGSVGEAMLAAAAWQHLFQSAWAALNAALVLLGVALIVLGREPRWAIAAWRWRPAPVAGAGGAFRRGTLWALMPCGALYGAAGLAVLAARPLPAAAVMAIFGLMTTVGLAVGHRLLRRADRRAATAGYRLQGLLLAIVAAIGLAAAIAGVPHPFCS